ncbi:MAG: hypothetical protein PUC37_11305 [Spirochaetales bacterium]|nr:hypothetical protein [Spirochaetales bacterium]
MKKSLLKIILILLCSNIFAQNFSLNGHYFPAIFPELDYINITENEINYVLLLDDEKKVTTNYKVIKEDGMLFFEMDDFFPIKRNYLSRVSSSKKMIVLAGKQTSEDKSKVLFLHGAILFFGDLNDYEKFGYLGGFISPDKSFCDSIYREYYNCSSYLVERKREYKVENLCNSKVGTPWVEGVPGDGIGEGFTINNSDIDVNHPYENTTPYLLIMNGYISYDKPYLYKQNNRIKKIKVTGVKSGKSKILDVLDTPHPQTVDISFITEPEDIRVEIADVYKGTKYDDTCINFCITYKDKVIPYEDSVK